MSPTVLIPAAARDDIEDTVAAVRRWLPASRIVVVNDSDRALPSLHADPAVTVLTAPRFRNPRLRGVWPKLVPALRWVLDHDDAPLVLRLDADALVLRGGFDLAAAALAAEHSDAGLFGSHRLGPDGAPRDFTDARRVLRHATGPRGLRHPLVRGQLRSWVRLAAQHAYEPGEHALAAALLLRRELLLDWRRRGWLDGPIAETPVPVPDDYLFALLTRAAGYGIADAGGPGGVFALRWRGLPASPQDLLDGTAYVTHSVRGWQDLDEAAIRAFFRDRR